MTSRRGPLQGIRIVELAGIGPAPMCGMLLSDLGADIIRIDRTTPSDVGIRRAPETNFVLRGRPTVQVDLKTDAGRDLALRLVAKADCLIEGFRPGVMERLGLGPAECLAAKPTLVYGRVTGWGQTGPLAMTAGHDLNYIGLTGALHAMGRRGESPPVPLNLIGDFAGGALFLAMGLLAGVLEARQSGRGQVVDAAIVDGVSTMMTSINGLRAGGTFSKDRGDNILDSGAFFYDVYECADGEYVSVAPIEPKFYGEFLRRLGLPASSLPAQADRAGWALGRATLARLFREKTRAEWIAVFGVSDSCVAPVLSLEEAFLDPHLSSRETFRKVGAYEQASPAPRFSRTPPDTPRAPGTDDSLSALADWLGAAEAEAARNAGAIPG